MMNITDEDIDLGLALGSSNCCSQARFSSGRRGVGVNANSRVDIASAASDPLSELVWSPHKGLSLKCADSSLAENKCLLPQNMDPHSIRSKGIGDDKVVDEKKLTVSQTMLDSDGKFEDKAILFRSSGGSSTSGNNGTMEGEPGNVDAIQKEENRKDNVEADLCSSQNVQITDVAESSKKNAAQDILPDGTRGSEVNMAINQRFTSNLIPAPPSMRLESSSENDLEHRAAKEAHSSGETRLPREKSPTNSRICLHGGKGKERALSDGDICGKSLNDDDDDSHESVESCNSAGLLSKGIKRRRYDQEQLVGSKRMKRQIQGSDSSTSLVRCNSSFMNWMSNMVKGLSDCYKEDSSSLTLALARPNDVCHNNHRGAFTCNKTHDHCESQNTGFQNVFQSLYCRNAKMPNSGVHKDNVTENLMVADKKSLKYLPPSCDGNKDNSHNQIILSDKEVKDPLTSRDIVGHPSKPSEEFSCTPFACMVGNKVLDIPVPNRAKGEVSPSDSLCKHVTSNTENTSLSTPLETGCLPEKSNPLASLWITRLYTRTDQLENCNPITEEARDCSTECPKANLDNRVTGFFSNDQKTSEARNASAEDEVHATESTPKPSPRKLSQGLRSSEAMASVFAKRLDALRHIIHPSEERKSSTCTVICFFCGKSGHDLRKCPELTETELEDLIVKMSTFERVEESPCLCIRCFEFDHWAISCPLVFSHRPRLGSYLTWNVKDSSTKPLSTSNEFQKSSRTNSDNDLKDKQIFQPCNFVDAQEEMFDAIRRLRLSRSDILRWMNSDVSLSRLNGFFLRLRLGNLGGLGWTGYYVACITGETVENVGCNSKKSILVDVGGMKSSVGSQYVSNNDFLEDEIKAWWTRVMKSGGKIPSIDELNSKFQEKKCFGF